MKELVCLIVGALGGGAVVYFYLDAKLQQLQQAMSAGVAAVKKAGL